MVKKQEHTIVANSNQDSPSKYSMQDLFDEVLCRHMERLLGTRYGIRGLPLNLLTIPCLTLLTEQGNKEVSLSPTAERYTLEKLSNELSEMGLELREDLDLAVQDMIEKGCIEVDEDGRFSAHKPITSMSQLLDHIFPRMPGINRIAYFIQTIDEVKSRRKDPKSAISQFDQTLRMHTVPPKRVKNDE